MRSAAVRQKIELGPSSTQCSVMPYGIGVREEDKLLYRGALTGPTCHQGPLASSLALWSASYSTVTPPPHAARRVHICGHVHTACFQRRQEEREGKWRQRHIQSAWQQPAQQKLAHSFLQLEAAFLALGVAPQRRHWGARPYAVVGRDFPRSPWGEFCPCWGVLTRLLWVSALQNKAVKHKRKPRS